MKTWAKVVAGFAAVLVLLCVLGGAALVGSGAWDNATRFGGGILQMKRSAEGLQALDKEFPFTPPAGGAVPEERLLAYATICEAVVPAAAPYDAWMRDHQGQKGDFRDAREELELMAALLDASCRALREQKMSAREFGWIRRAVEAAREEAAEKAGSPVAREMLETLRREAASPALPEAERKALQEKVARYEAALAQAGEPLSSNAALYLKHAERLKGCELGEFGGMMLQGGGEPRRQRRAGVGEAP